MKNNNKNHQTRNVILSIVFLLGGWVGVSLGCLKLLDKISKPAGIVTLEGTGIVLGAVAAFAGLLIPLHYALALDIIGKLKESNPSADNLRSKVAREREWLLRYCHTSDIVIFVTALFGASSLVEGAFIMGSHFKILLFCDCSLWVGRIYLLVVTASIFISFWKAKKEWELSYRGGPFFSYCVFIFIIGSSSIFWGLGLIYLNNENTTAFLALLTLSCFYFSWLLLRVVFIPMSRVSYLLLFVKKRRHNS